MQRRSPASTPKPVALSGDYPSNVFIPNTVLFPTEKGNPGRRFNDQELGELIAGNKAVLDYAISFNVWAASTGVLTELVLPKIKLVEGVQRVEGKRFEYDIVPTTAVPPRGTVRFMSKHVSSFSLAIGQKGIGSKFEGRALRSAFGPQLLAMEIQAYAESINLGMAWNTAINVINAAYRYEYSSAKGPDFNRNKAQAMANEISHWCALGTDPARINVAINKIVTEKPDINLMLVPENFTTYMNEASLRGQFRPSEERPIIKYALRGGQIAEIESSDKIVTIMSLNNGIDVYKMPEFRIGKESIQPLSTISRIGEVYPMRGYLDAENKFYLKSSLDIYIYDEPEDNFVKLKFDDMVRHGAIWDFSGSSTWDPRLIKERDELNARIAKTNGANGPTIMDKLLLSQPMYPFSRTTVAPNQPQQLMLPSFIGNLDEAHLDNEEFTNAVQSVVAQVSAGGMLLADALDEIAAINELRQKIEEEPYNADYFAEVARRNINRSVTVSADGPVFVGQTTNPRRVANNVGARAIVEWAPNRVGGLDIPNNFMPAGCWSAAGLRTIAATEGHPLARDAQHAYLFLSKLASRSREVLQASAVYHMDEMPVNMPKDDEVELVMRACFGPRVPIFLAAPLGLASANKSRDEAARRPAQRGPDGRVVKIALGPTIADPEGIRRASTGSSAQGIFFTALNDQGVDYVAWQSPSGVIFVLDRDVAERMALPTKGFSESARVFNQEKFVSNLFGADEVGQLSQKAKDYFGDEAEKYVLMMLDILVRQSSSLEVRQVLTGLRMLKLVLGAGKKEDFGTYINALSTGETSALKSQLVAIDITPKDESTIKTTCATLKKASESPLNGVESSAISSVLSLSGNIKKVLDERRAASPGFTMDKKYIYTGRTDAEKKVSDLFGKIGYTAFDSKDLGTINTQTKNAIDEQITVLSATKPSAPAFVVEGDQERQATSLDLVGVKYYRTPLNMTIELLNSVASVQLPWILPGDNNKHFNVPIDLQSQADGDYLNENVYKLPHYSQSQSVAPLYMPHWSHSGALSRAALIHGHYNTEDLGVTGGATSHGVIRSRGILDIADQHLYEAGGARRSADSHRAIVKDPDFVKGQMESRLRYITGEAGSNFVRRLCGIAYCLVPADYGEAMRALISQNIMPPFGALAWRLRSDHQVIALFLSVAGMKTGANFYNGAHFDWAQDATRDVYQTRAVITTDAHVIRPENLRLIHAAMPSSYNGGHNARVIQSEENFTTGPALRQPSVLPTICSLHLLKNKSSPLSFQNQPPAQIERVGNGISEIDWDRQYFSGSHYYCEKVYPRTYGSASMPNQIAMAVSAQTLTYRAAPTENHIAFDGYFVGYDYGKKHYVKERLGNGHRHNRRLNMPGARAYLNGETSVLPPERLIYEFMLS